ncbi:MAG TPA: hypothetical protein VGP44_11625 [Gemmatimonadales bacterium]|nr:hypothetical protein [Gemmatimonadales bacterium]
MSEESTPPATPAAESLTPFDRLRACREHSAPEPPWEWVGDMVLGSWRGEHCCGGLFLQEAAEHPEQPPLLALRQFHEGGKIYGEIWFAWSDVPAIIASLSEHLDEAKRQQWRDRDGGPLQYLGLPA